MYFLNYRLSKTWLDLSVENAVSEHLSTVNMLTGPKHIWNLHESTFIEFFRLSEEKWFRKNLSYWSLKS